MSEQAPSQKRIEITEAFNAPVSKEVAPNRHRHTSHHGTYHKQHPAESVAYDRAQFRQQESVPVPHVPAEVTIPEHVPVQIAPLDPATLEQELSQFASAAVKHDKPAVTKAIEVAPAAEVPAQEEAPETEADPQAEDEEDLGAYSPEEAESILAVEAEDTTAPVSNTMPAEFLEKSPAPEVAPVVQPVVEEVTEAVEAEAAPTVEAVAPVHTPEQGDPVEFNGEKMSIGQILTAPNGTVIYEVMKADASTVLAYANQLVFFDTEKEKEALEELRKEAWDEGSEIVKKILTFSHLGDSWTDPQDITINRHVDQNAPFEEQEDMREANRVTLIAGSTAVFMVLLMVAAKYRANERLFSEVK